MITTKKTLPAWNKYLLKSTRHLEKLQYGSSVLMGHYLVVIAAEGPDVSSDGGYGSEDEPEYSTLIFVIDLRDNSVQEIEEDRQFLHSKNDTLLKLHDNQILIFPAGPTDTDYGWQILKIESFQPFTFELESLYLESDEKITNHTAQMYCGHLYVFGQWHKGYTSRKNELLSFDLSSLIWNYISCFKDGPPSLDMPSSCIIGDRLYIYGGNAEDYQDEQPDIFEYEFASEEWTKLEQEEDYFYQRKRSEVTGDVYKDNLVLLESNRLCFWDPDTDSWSNFDIETPETGICDWTTNLIIYKDLLLKVGEKGNGVYLYTFNLQNINLDIEETAEQQVVRSLFMNEEEADIIFKIQEKVIPAHKTILTQKSRYFTNLFKSGMSESRQQIIEVSDCEYDLFKDFLRFLYFGELKLDADLAIKLFTLADKYLQNDLVELCQDFLKQDLNSENVYAILEFAHLQESENLKSWCTKFLKSNLNEDNIFELILYLDKQSQEENPELRDSALSFVIENYARIHHDAKDFYDNFLIKNIAIDTILKLANFIGSAKNTGILREVILYFADENFAQLKEKKIVKDFSKDFLVDFASYQIDNKNKLTTEIKHLHQRIEELGSEMKLRNGLKRMESVKKDDDHHSDENPTLKKTKKSPSQAGNDN